MKRSIAIKTLAAATAPRLLIQCNAAGGYIVRRGGRKREDSSRKRANAGKTAATARAILGSGRPSTGMARPRAAARYAARSTLSHILPALGGAL
jgi:hypothetical protein